MSLIGKKLGIMDPKCNRLNLSDNVENGVAKAKSALLQRACLTETSLFTDNAELSHGPLTRETRNCSTYDQPVSSNTKLQTKRLHERDEAPETEISQKLVVEGCMDKGASFNTWPRAKKVRRHDNTPVSEVYQDFVFGGDMNKCVSCLQLWPDVDTTGLCNDCRHPQ